MIDYTDLLGKEFKYGGRGPEHYDCYGLAIEVRRRAGLTMPADYLSCEEPFDIHERITAAKPLFKQLVCPRMYCLVSFMLHPPYTSHMGVVLDRYRFIHIMQKSRVAVERIDDRAWCRRITGYWELNDE